jgi:hypothetical protein
MSDHSQYILLDSSKLRFVDMYTVSTRYYSHLNMVTLVEAAVSSGLYESESEDYDQVYCHVNSLCDCIISCADCVHVYKPELTALSTKVTMFK